MIKEIFIWLITAVIATILIGTIVMWLWNALMPEIFNLPHLTWIQSLGIYFLSHLLFNSRVDNNVNNDKK